jgi:hypothetical protein
MWTSWHLLTSRTTETKIMSFNFLLSYDYRTNVVRVVGERQRRHSGRPKERGDGPSNLGAGSLLVGVVPVRTVCWCLDGEA